MNLLRGGMIGWSLVGKRVAIYTENQFGCWGEYAICDITKCIELDEFHNFEQAACSFVNPFAVIGMYEIAK